MKNSYKQLLIKLYKSMDKKSKTEIALEIIQGKWGNGEERKRRLESKWYNYREVQDEVNKITHKEKYKMIYLTM